jgi:hypothetical protein
MSELDRVKAAASGLRVDVPLAVHGLAGRLVVFEEDARSGGVTGVAEADFETGTR